MWRDSIHGVGQGHHGDTTTTGAVCYSSLQDTFWFGSPAPLLKGDKVGLCPACGKRGSIGEGSMNRVFGTNPVALDGAVILCGCPDGSNRLRAPLGTWFGNTPPPHPYEPPHIVSARMSEGRSEEPVQHAQAAKKPRPEPLPLPALIYQTTHKMDDYQANDMRCGDLTVSALRNTYRIDLDTVSLAVNAYTLREINPLNPFGIVSPYAMPETQKQMPSVTRNEAAALMFDEFRELAKEFSFHGETQNIISDMITHMQGDSGKPYSNPLLDKALKEQILNDQSGQSSLLRIKTALHDAIDAEYGFIPLANKSDLDDAVRRSVLPKFSRVNDFTNGLVITVHDTWATHITLESLEVSGDSYRAKLHYRIQDHFGLDDADVMNPVYHKFRIFRLWFVLQRWDRYAYRPFITEMNATVDISGRLGE